MPVVRKDVQNDLFRQLPPCQSHRLQIRADIHKHLVDRVDVDILPGKHGSDTADKSFRLISIYRAILGGAAI